MWTSSKCSITSANRFPSRRCRRQRPSPPRAGYLANATGRRASSISPVSDMPKNIKPGDKVNGYTITALLNKGAMATAYAATSSSGQKVFFKQYKSPTVTVPWYKGYVKYQAELKRRLETTRAKEYCY